MNEIGPQQNKQHHGSKKGKEKAVPHAKGHNPKAFTSQSGAKAARLGRRKVEKEQAKLHVPAVDRTFGGFAQGASGQSSTIGAAASDEGPPPVIVAIIGPPGVGKTTLIRSLVRRYTKSTMADLKGPVTVVSGKLRRLTFIECPNDLGAMVDVCKVADLVLLMIDGSYGFEMEIFEALSALSSHGLPKIIAVLTHLDLIKKAAALKAQKTALKKRFWTEVYDGAKMFYLSGVMNGRYPDREILNLSRFINVAKFRPLTFRNTHSYFLADRLEDTTPQETIKNDPKADRTVALYGYLRGIPLRPPSESHPTRIHIPGTGVDAFSVLKLTKLVDPCPLPTNESEKRRKLSEKDRVCHAPMSGSTGGQLVMDGDTIFINTAGTFSHKVDEDGNPIEAGEGEQMVLDLQEAPSTLAESMAHTQIRLFDSSAAPIAFQSKGVDDFSDASEGEEGAESGSDADAEHFVPDATAGGRRSGQRATEPVFDDEGSDAEDLAFDDDSEDDLDGDDGELAPGPELEDGDLSDEDMDEDVPRWKQDLQQRATAAFRQRISTRKTDWTQLIYASDLTPEQIASGDTANANQQNAQPNEDDLFQLAELSTAPEDVYRPRPAREVLQKWEGEDLLDSIRHLFITGGATSTAEEGPGYNPDTGEGFVDLEAAETDADAAEEDEAAEEERKAKELAEKKEKLKKKFDQQYDDSSDDDKEDFFTSEKNAMVARLNATDAEFKDDSPEVRALIQGYKPGTYVRIELSVPAELVLNFNPRYPIIVGGLLGHEESFGVVTVRIKKHRWFPKQVLKSNDPLIFSMGWRRFQTVPVYSMDDGTRTRLLKYTPEHMHCLATFYGPVSAPSTGFCAFNSLGGATGFRISATGSVLDIAGSTAIVKKLKLTGTPFKIFKNTAFIKDMFNSSLEIAKFEGAQIRTVSGLRGQIKKALSKPEGTFRATFEDRILASDIVVLKAWTRVEPRKYYNPVASLLLQDKSTWQGMRLTGQVRMAEGVKTPNLANSQYKTIERATRRFNPLKVPRNLQASLPYASKTKTQKPKKEQTYLQKRAVVLSPEEKKAMGLLQQINAIQRVKTNQRAEKQTERRKEKQKVLEKSEEARQERERRERKEHFRTQGLKEKRKSEGEGSARPRKRKK